MSMCGLWMRLCLCLLLLVGNSLAAEPMDSEGNYGSTSWISLPFQNQFMSLSYGSSPDLSPVELFFDSNPNSTFLNPAAISVAQRAAAGLEAQGLLPYSGAQRWQDTYIASFPLGTWTNEPSYVNADRTSGDFMTKPEFQAWRKWIENRPQYSLTAPDGGLVPTDYRSMGALAQWGFISPHMPLDAADFPPGAASATYGDWYAWRWGLTANRSGAYAISLSDFSDSQPSSIMDYNPRIIAAFGNWAGYPSGVVPGDNITEQADYLSQNDFNRWVDFMCGAGYGNWYNGFITQLGANTNRQGVVIDQNAGAPSQRRLAGTDARIFFQYFTQKNFISVFDTQAQQVGRSGFVQSPPMQELGGAVLSAAREPLQRNGMNLEADDAAYWAATTTFYPTLDSQSQTEVGLKLLKQIWLASAWAHIADRSGNIRRAICFTSRDYWDAGNLTSIDPVTRLIQTIYPTRPIGAAIYYSVAVERAVEKALATSGPGRFPYWLSYFNTPCVQKLLDSGCPIGYYVSDAALPTIQSGAINAPSAWVTVDPIIAPSKTGNLPSSESSSLQSVAPMVIDHDNNQCSNAKNVCDSLAQLPHQPLLFQGGLAGFGFYDQNNNLVIVVRNPSTAPNATSVSGNILLSNIDIPDGPMTASLLLTGTNTTITWTNGAATIPITLQRWDVEVLSLSGIAPPPPSSSSGAGVLFNPLRDFLAFLSNM